MANPITAIASRSCAKNSMLKQTKEDEKDLSKGAETRQVSTTVDVPIAQAGGTNIMGTKTDTTVTTPGSEGVPEKRKTILYSDLPEDQREAARKYNMEKYGTLNPTAEGMADNTVVVQEAIPATPPKKETETETTPDYETKKGMTTFDIRKDFRRQKIAERLAGKSEKQARRFAKRAERLRKRGKTEKAKIFAEYEGEGENKKLVGGKAGNAAQRAANLKDRLKQFKIQQDQGSFGSGESRVIKTQENLDAAKQRLKASNNPNTYTGTEPTDMQRLGKGLVKTAESIGQGIGDLTKPLGSVVEDILSGAKSRGPIKKNYFNK